ncbi:hypothetical protein NDU88_001970 [Pleurodeles waltl]|uniref:Uncharacterized protein n=1 Tax=Pleurodeles waltl TaxID=8319 RepID=A0AAV7NKP4_PLEWA|nr:hypothetical protein NDU88_001970 [Pleurodeles waltl]
MDILIRDAREKRERLLLDIETLEKEIQDTNLKEAIDKNYDILKNVLQQHQEYIKENKMRKLRRDANDYAAGIRNDGDHYYFKLVSPSKKLVKKEWAKALLPAAGLPSFLFTDRVASEVSANPLLGFKSRKRPEPEIDSGL